MRTRARASKGSSKAASTAKQAETETESKSLAAAETNPPKLFILPKDASPDARFITIPNPANGTLNRYLFCPKNGLYEFTRVAAPKTSPRSFLITPSSTGSKPQEKADTADRDHGQEKESMESDHAADRPLEAAEDQEEKPIISQGYVTKDADLLVATPVDLLFLVLPILAPKGTPIRSSRTTQLFLSFDDHMEATIGLSEQIKFVFREKQMSAKVEERIGVVCDTVAAGDEKMYRLSQDKLLQELLNKAHRMCANGLPASMEEQFVRRPLEVPVTNERRAEEDSLPVRTPEDEKENNTSDSQSSLLDSEDSQKSDTTASSAETTVTISDAASDKTPSEEIVKLQRLRTALQFLLSTYLPHNLREVITMKLSANQVIDFAPLDEHLEHIASLKSQAAALRSLSDNISRKRGNDDELAEERAEKKRKKEEDEKKKKAESKALKQLKKVDTSGMKKMSAFFAPKAKT